MLIYKYPKLFHKYILNVSTQTDEIFYILKANNDEIIVKKKHIVHLHIFNIELFDNFYGNYIDLLKKHFTIFITYIIGDKSLILENLKKELDTNNLYIINVKNKGYDIGPKFVFLYLLEKYNINTYNSILFLHSKTNNEKRYLYFTPLIGNEEIIIQNIRIMDDEEKQNIGGIFPNMFKKEEHDVIRYSFNTLNYINEITSYYDIKHKNIIDFSEGNCMYLHKNVINYIFKNKTKLWYNLCNSIESFDENWVRKRYNKPNSLKTQDLYNDFINNSIHFKINNSEIPVGNNLANPNHDMPDGMFEHAWERLWVNFIYECNMNYKVNA